MPRRITARAGLFVFLLAWLCCRRALTTENCLFVWLSGRHGRWCNGAEEQEVLFLPFQVVKESDEWKIMEM